jgi:hypothetical protein
MGSVADVPSAVVRVDEQVWRRLGAVHAVAQRQHGIPSQRLTSDAPPRIAASTSRSGHVPDVALPGPWRRSAPRRAARAETAEERAGVEDRA